MTTLRTINEICHVAWSRWPDDAHAPEVVLRIAQRSGKKFSAALVRTLREADDLSPPNASYETSDNRRRSIVAKAVGATLPEAVAHLADRVLKAKKRGA